MTEASDGGDRTMRDSFRVWNVDAVEREVVLRSSDDQYVAVPLPTDRASAFERLADTAGTVEATLVPDDGKASWRIAAIHAIDERG